MSLLTAYKADLYPRAFHSSINRLTIFQSLQALVPNTTKFPLTSQHPSPKPSNMQFLTVLALAGAAMAVPANIMQSRQANLCSGLSGTAQCCATDVLGIADLDCSNRKSI